MDWENHKYANKLGYYWYTNPEVSHREKNILYFKMLLNYQGFWANKLVHGFLFYKLYQKKYFNVNTEFLFWTRTLGTLVLFYFSLKSTDKVLRQQLVHTTEDLHYKYGAAIDSLRENYQKNKFDLKMNKQLQLQKLHEQGKNVKQLQ